MQDVTIPCLRYDLVELRSYIHRIVTGELNMKKIIGFVLFIVVLASLSACAPNAKVQLDKPDSEMQFTTPGANPEVGTPAENGKVAGLGTGLWHGLISVVTLILSFTNPDMQMYEVHNTGPLYNLGFLLGSIMLFTLLGYTGGRRR